MRIWYQSLTEESGLPVYFDGMRERARRIARADTEVDFVGMPAGTYGGKAPADVVVYPYLMSLHHQSILDNAYTAQQRGFDVFVLGLGSGSGDRTRRAACCASRSSAMASRRCM